MEKINSAHSVLNHIGGTCNAMAAGMFQSRPVKTSKRLVTYLDKDGKEHTIKLPRKVGFGQGLRNNITQKNKARLYEAKRG